MGRLHGCGSVRLIEVYLYSVCIDYLNNDVLPNYSTLREQKGSLICAGSIPTKAKYGCDLLPSADSMGSHPYPEIHEA
jgi:hypothetical protein